MLFTSGGSDSVESAVKLARRYWVEQGAPDKTIVVGRSRAYHGMHVAGTSLAGIDANGEGYGELMSDTETVAWDDAKSLLGLVERIGDNRWRLVLPAPAYESLLDVIELVPAS